MNERDPDRAVSHTVRAQLALRDLILSGRLRPNERISELGAVETTGVSRTPVRNALSTLGAEGLLDYTPNSGYVVRSYSAKDIADIYEVRDTGSSRQTHLGTPSAGAVMAKDWRPDTLPQR